VVIVGKSNGRIFRPSSPDLNWANRLCGWFVDGIHHVTNFGAPLGFASLLYPFTNSEGVVCLFMDDSMQNTAPNIYQAVMDFAKAHELEIQDGDKDAQ